MDVLPAGEAMGEQRIGARRANRRVEQRSEILPWALGKSKRSAGMSISWQQRYLNQLLVRCD